MSYSRRRVLALGAAAVTAGCLGGSDADDSRGGAAENGADSDLPVATAGVPGSRDLDAYTEASVDVLGKDGIPAIDEPSFVGADDAGFLAPDDVVFGVARGDTVKAYPRRILAWHEIVNDRVDGDPVAVTYCPLTGTVIGYRRGATTFGVSGDLVNSNLIMYDRATDSRWPQMLGVAASGSRRGDRLQEFPVVWTTWERWRDAHPETDVLSRETGTIRDYERDPYGSYAPIGGYYGNDDLLFETMGYEQTHHPKDVFVGARTVEAAVAFAKEALRDDAVASAGGFTAVYDETLDVGRVYRNPDGVEVTAQSDGYAVAGEDGAHAPDALPLEPVPAFDAMWFAWNAFFPETAVHA